ncbi:MAG: hypothetical protein H6672_04410 [Anaerolineaceae bacterium]|nr:hypothetical protein [Anaerolineaceae bacterium]
MTSRTIWRQLRNPASPHPLARRVLKERARIAYPPFGPGLQLLCGFMLCISMLSPVGIILIGLGLFLVINSTAYTLAWVVSISGRIARVRADDQYTLISATPPGKLGVHWAVCTGILHRSSRFDRIHRLIQLLLGTILALVIIVTLITLSEESTSNSRFIRSMTVLANFSLLLLVIYADHIQSIVLGCLAGMLAPLYVYRPIDARFAAGVFYLLVQCVSYLLALMIAGSGVNGLFGNSDQILLVSLLRVALFVGIREGFVVLLWYWLLQKSDSSPEQPFAQSGVSAS